VAGPNFFGKEVGEVAFAVVGAVATGLMGLTPDAPRQTIGTLPRLSDSLKWAKLAHVPVMHNEITVEHRGKHESTLTNSAGPTLRWKASFPAPESGQHTHILVDGVRTPASVEPKANGQLVISTVIAVDPGRSKAARYLA